MTRQRDRLLTLVLDGKVDADLYRERDDALKSEIASLTAELRRHPVGHQNRRGTNQTPEAYGGLRGGSSARCEQSR